MVKTETLSLRKSAINSGLKLFGFFLFGFICFSGWSNYIVTQLIGLRYYVFEVLLIPFLIYYWRQIQSNYRLMRQNTKTITVLFLIYAFVCMWIGFVKSGGHFEAIVTTSRTLFYLIIIAGFFSTGIKLDISKIHWICIGATLGGGIYNSLFVLDEAGYSSLNIIAVTLMVLIPASQAKMKQTAFCTIIAAIIAFVSGYRINIVMILAALVIGIFSNLLRRKTGVKPIVVLIIFVISAVIIYKNFYPITDFLIKTFDMDSFTVYRARDRLYAFFSMDFEASRDMVRFDLYQQIGDQFLEKLIPCGLIGKSAGYYGTYFDVPIIFLYDAIGSLAAWIIVIILAYKGLRSYVFVIRNSVDAWSVVCGEMIFVYLFLIIVNGRFLFIAYETLLTGLIFGNWLYLSRQKKNCAHYNTGAFLQANG